MDRNNNGRDAPNLRVCLVPASFAPVELGPWYVSSANIQAGGYKRITHKPAIVFIANPLRYISQRLSTYLENPLPEPLSNLSQASFIQFFRFLQGLLMMSQFLRILLVGSGGREHALAWKLAKSSTVEKIFVVPGNGGTAGASPKIMNADVPPNDYPALVSLAQQLNIDLVVPGPDVPVVAGLADLFRAG